MPEKLFVCNACGEDWYDDENLDPAEEECPNCYAMEAYCPEGIDNDM